MLIDDASYTAGDTAQPELDVIPEKRRPSDVEKRGVFGGPLLTHLFGVHEGAAWRGGPLRWKSKIVKKAMY
jgi:hypothetical protein